MSAWCRVSGEALPVKLGMLGPDTAGASMCMMHSDCCDHHVAEQT